MFKDSEYYKSGLLRENSLKAQIKAVESNKLKKIERDRLKLEKYILNPKVCIGCGEIHDFEHRNNKYCSASCGVRIANANRTPRSLESRIKTSNTLRNTLNKNKQKYLPNYCINCDNIINKNRKYCNDPQCRFEQRSISSKKGRQTSKDNGTFIGWTARTVKPSYPEQYFIDLFANENIVEYIKELRVGKWFIDFAFKDLKLAIEIDGAQHKLEERKNSDKIKDAFLISNGWKVFRIEWFNPINQKNKNKLYPQIEAMKLLFESQ